MAYLGFLRAVHKVSVPDPKPNTAPNLETPACLRTTVNMPLWNPNRGQHQHLMSDRIGDQTVLHVVSSRRYRAGSADLPIGCGRKVASPLAMFMPRSILDT